MKQYLDLLQKIMDEGVDSDDRTGVGTRSIFGYQMRFDLNDGFPAVTTKKLAWKAVVSELLWFLEGSSDERRLAEILYGKPREELVGKKTIWTANADKQGVSLGYRTPDTVKQLGPVYGVQWRNWGGPQGKSYSPYDQIASLINTIQNNPNDRRMILSAWNVSEIGKMALPPCHLMANFNVKDNKLSCLVYQRSADCFLGSPFNIASYALLTHMIAHVTGIGVGELIYTTGDTHIYKNHIDQVKLQLSRKPHKLPILKINPHVNDIDSFTMGDFELLQYEHYDSIKAPMAV